MSGVLIAIEGGDGAGKATAAAGLAASLASKGLTCRVMSFPRYGDTMGGKALGDFLAGRTPAPEHPSALAVLYALDRFESRAAIGSAAADYDVVIFDRYIGSNVAYQAAKVPEVEREELIRWIVNLETHTFALPRPDLNVYLDTPPNVARELMQRKPKRSYIDESFDAHEADRWLQAEIRKTYSRLAVEQPEALGPWHRFATVRSGQLLPADEIAAELLSLVQPLAEAGRVSALRMTATA